jgi:hypothetical protein
VTVTSGQLGHAADGRPEAPSVLVSPRVRRPSLETGNAGSIAVARSVQQYQHKRHLIPIMGEGAVVSSH